MRSFVWCAFIIVCIIVCVPSSIYAERYTQCDPCGLCKDTLRSKGEGVYSGYAGKAVYIQPESWQRCFSCLYPSISPPPAPPCGTDENGKEVVFVGFPNNVEVTKAPNDPNYRCDTLLVASNNGLQNPPQSGRQYSDIGCISVDTANKRFSDPNASVDVINRLLTMVTGITGAVGTVFILIAGISLMTSRGNAENIQEGKRRLTNTIIGVVFALFSLFIFRFIASVLLRVPGLG